MTTPADPRDVKRLADRVADTRKYRAQEDAIQKARNKRKKDIDDTPDNALTSFWCDECKRDFSTMGRKRLNWVYNLDTGMNEPPEVWRAWYEGFCLKGHKCIRRITDKHNDPYYYQSIMIRRQQAEHADEMLTPDDPRFAKVYPQQWARIQAEIEEREIAKWQEEKALKL